MTKLVYVSLFIAVVLIYGCELHNIDYRGETSMKSRQSTFEYKGFSINYEDQGQGQPIILLHGFGAGTYTWRHILTHFSKAYRVIAIDLKGHGLSDKPRDNNYSVADQGDIIYEFIKEHSLDNVTLVGNSMGGAVSITTYLMQCDHGTNYISKLVLIDSASYRQRLPVFISVLRIPIINVLLPCLTSTKFRARNVLQEAFFDRTGITEDMVASYASYLSLPGSSYALTKTAQQIVPSNIDEVTERYKSITIPVLIIWGEKDTIIPLEVGRKLAANIPNSKLVVIPNCGHIPQEECPSQAIEAMESFMQ
ncbi:MAG TPA: alpha/beta hydrolase [Deltaproteobacteria bacterium]|jgi:pimeloyl-ACP methyl ester carboxylesterase|nr:alpha/beta hydrolase [Deltaproteobacteria bacterium]